MTLKSVQGQNPLNYDPSKRYVYSYETEVSLNDANSKRASRPQQDVGVKISLDFELSTAYRDKDVHMFKLQVSVITQIKLCSPLILFVTLLSYSPILI